MTDQQPEEPTREGRPVLSGILALLGVAVLVGVILGGGALAATRVLGVSDDGSASDDSSQEETLVVPDPSETRASEPSITLSSTPDSDPTETETKPPEPEFDITLESEQKAVGPMEPIDLTGSYPGGDGAILRVQQWEDGAWGDFPVTAPVNGGSFYTYIQASAVGLNRFRMKDTDSGEVSNEVKVQIG